MNGEDLVIPQDPNAADDAREELAQLSDLFGPRALQRRLSLLDESGRRMSGIPLPADERLAAKVERSLTWATVSEVALRILFPDIEAGILERLDAFTTAIRISRGLAERQDSAGLPLVDSLCEIGADIAEDLGVDPHVVSVHQSSVELLRGHVDEPRIWTEPEVRLAVESLPVKVSLRAAGDLAEKPAAHDWRREIGGQFGACQYLGLDLALLAAPEAVAGSIASPARDCLRAIPGLPGGEGDLLVAQTVAACLPVMEGHAIDLQESIGLAESANAPDIVLSYARSALVAAATSYQVLAALGRV